MGERMLSLLMMRDTRVEDTWPATESCSDRENEATPLVRLPLVLPPTRILIWMSYFVRSYLTFAGVALDALHAGQEGGAAGARHPPGELPGCVEGGGGAGADCSASQPPQSRVGWRGQTGRNLSSQTPGFLFDFPTSNSFDGPRRGRGRGCHYC